jgi:prephenate dehydratase
MTIVQDYTMNNQPLRRSITVSALSAGSVSDEAAHALLQHMPGVALHYHRSISDVFMATVEGKTQFSVIPIENTIEGSVNLHMDWLVHEVNIPIQAEWVYPSRQHFIADKQWLVDADGTIHYECVDRVLSHPVALAQCRRFLAAKLPHVEQEQVSSTAEAVRIVAENPGKPWAAIGTQRAAAMHHLTLIARAVTDHDNNYTRFLLVGKQPFDLTYAPRQATTMKTTIVVNQRTDSPGTLHQMLSVFAWRKINLTKIESRPTKLRLGNYYFILDIELGALEPLLQAALGELNALGYDVRILGSYPSFEQIELDG